METITTFPAQTIERRIQVKKFLTTGIISLTSEKFSIFVGVIAALVCWAGAFLSDESLIGFGALVFLSGYSPRVLRSVLRDLRQLRLGISQF